MHIKHKLINLIDKLEKSIGENTQEVWMHDLEWTVWATFADKTEYHMHNEKHEVEIIKYKGFYKEFDDLKETIYNMETQ